MNNETTPRSRWQSEYESGRKREDTLFTTVSSAEAPPLVDWEDLQDFAPQSKLGYPGQYPFTRGIHPTHYRGKLWTMRMFSGFATPEATNQRFKFLLEHGQTGLSVAFDLPTLMGRDSDDPWCEGEVGKCGVAVCSLRDMETLFDGITMEKVSTSMTINSPAAIMWAFYIAAAEKQGADRRKLRGTIQNDILKEYIAQKEYIFPPKHSMRLEVDTIEFGTSDLPEWNTISISGYHIREAGSTAVQELAFTLADGMAFVEAAMARGLDVDAFAPRLSFFFNAHIDFFEEIAKYRAARRIWARKMRDKYRAKNPRSWILRFHTQTAGCSLTAQQPENNIVRTAIEALAGVLGGTQSLHTNSMDETLALPSDKAAKIALRTQQIIACETGVANVIDPLGGSYFIEALTDRMEAEAEAYFKRIDELGGVIAGIEAGFFQREIARAAYRHQLELESGKRIIVGVNGYVEKDEVIEIPLLKITTEDQARQMANLQEVRRKRDPQAIKRSLDRLADVARSDENTMPTFIECAHNYVTLGEMVNVLKEAFGEYREAAVF
ncbi:MAG: methylmalonyl-CoA mutase [Calditrichaeota bacterium]|nr:methylmalonyl-CoA mutase [Calditrichota bacterium]